MQSQPQYTPGVTGDVRYGAHPAGAPEAYVQRGRAVSFAAIIAGSITAIAATMILITLGTGIGLSFVSPYATDGMSATAFTVTAAIWLIVVQWLSSIIGGYVAGRLRNRYEGLHGDEVFFRDSAHGFVSWALASVFTAAILLSSFSSMLGAGTQAASVVAAGKASEQETSQGTMAESFDYYIDTMFRTSRANAAPVDEGTRMETSRIIMKKVADGEISDADKSYLTQLVGSRSGLNETDASARVDQTLSDIDTAKAKTQEAADATRKAAAGFSILTALSMLIGGFIAAVTAIIGGRHRDEY